MSLLSVENLDMYYGKLHVIRSVSFEMGDETVALLGRNGAGKTTLFRGIMGSKSPESGTIHFNGEDIVGQPPHEIARKGIGFVPADRGMFSTLTVDESISIFSRDRYQKAPSKIYEMFPQLEPISSKRCNNLSGGQQRLVSIARTLVLDPDLLLLDEPAEGLSPTAVNEVEEVIEDLRRRGISVMLAEHDLDFVFNTADYCYILDRGRIEWEGSVEELETEEDTLKERLGIGIQR